VRARLTAAQVAQAFRDACLAELDALKPGNVHRFGDDPRMSVTDFETSARVAAAPLAQECASVGARIRASVAATMSAVGHNTNLGIVLLCAPLATAALSDEAVELRQRGLWESTTIIWLGEFGRTPTINPNGGRDHFPRAWTTVLAGGGIHGGQAYGRTSADGGTVEENQVDVPDVLATLCRSLGVDPATQNISDLGRPIKIADGKPIEALLA